MLGAVKDYLKKVEKELQSGNAAEHSRRPELKSLIESFDRLNHNDRRSGGISGVHFTPTISLPLGDSRTSSAFRHFTIE